MTEKRPQNCGTGYCSCIECPYENEPAEQESVASIHLKDGCIVGSHKKEGCELEDGEYLLVKRAAAPVRTKDLTGQDLCDLEIAVGWKGDSHEFDVIVKAVIAKFKEKNK